MENKSIKSIIFFCLLVLGSIFFFNSCSKSGSSYGNNNNSGTGSEVSIKNFAFSVTSLTVNKGVSITWTNNDAVTHTITADDGSFDSGNITPGSTYSKTFATVGTFAYHCNIHTSMKAKVVVQ